MSGAPGGIPPAPEPATPLPRLARVISLDRRRGTEPEPSADPRRMELAVTIARLYRQEGLSLADPATAAVFRAALGVVSVLVDGALELGALEQQAPEIHAYLQTVLRDARDAPDLI